VGGEVSRVRETTGHRVASENRATTQHQDKIGSKCCFWADIEVGINASGA